MPIPLLRSIVHRRLEILSGAPGFQKCTIWRRWQSGPAFGIDLQEGPVFLVWRRERTSSPRCRNCRGSMNSVCSPVARIGADP